MHKESKINESNYVHKDCNRKNKKKGFRLRSVRDLYCEQICYEGVEFRGEMLL